MNAKSADADVWRIEKVRRALKEKLCGKVLTTCLELEEEIGKDERKFSEKKCEKKTMDEISSLTTTENIFTTFDFFFILPDISRKIVL